MQTLALSTTGGFKDILGIKSPCERGVKGLGFVYMYLYIYIERERERDVYSSEKKKEEVEHYRRV